MPFLSKAIMIQNRAGRPGFLVVPARFCFCRDLISRIEFVRAVTDQTACPRDRYQATYRLMPSSNGVVGS